MSAESFKIVVGPEHKWTVGEWVRFSKKSSPEKVEEGTVSEVDEGMLVSVERATIVTCWHDLETIQAMDFTEPQFPLEP